LRLLVVIKACSSLILIQRCLLVPSVVATKTMNEMALHLDENVNLVVSTCIKRIPAYNEKHYRSLWIPISINFIVSAVQNYVAFVSVMKLRWSTSVPINITQTHLRYF
jgi:hypothetical protein